MNLSFRESKQENFRYYIRNTVYRFYFFNIINRKILSVENFVQKSYFKIHEPLERLSLISLNVLNVFKLYTYFSSVCGRNAQLQVTMFNIKLTEVESRKFQHLPPNTRIGSITSNEQIGTILQYVSIWSDNKEQFLLDNYQDKLKFFVKTLYKLSKQITLFFIIN